MSDIRQELASFLIFALKRIKTTPDTTVENLLIEWRKEQKVASAFGDGDINFAELTMGMSEQNKKAFREHGRKLGIVA